MDKKCCSEGNVLLRIVFPVFIMSLLGTGCASYNAQTQKISQSYELGNIQAAAAQISAEADKRGEGKDAVVWRLEQGAVLRAAGKLEDSNRAFDKAEELVNKYEEAAKMSVSREALATVTNLTTLPYEGFAYDKIMMNTYKALNYLELGDYEKARVEINRAYKRQEDAAYLNATRIEKAQDEGSKKNLNVNMDSVNSDRKFKSQFDSYYSDLNYLRPYADYVNPMTVYLDALFYMTQATGGSDLERSRKSFERVLGMIGENKFIRQDMETIDQIIAGKPFPEVTYVIFETGLAPEREQIRVDLPLFLITPGVPYVGAAFPKLKYRGNHIPVLNVSYKEPVTPKHKGIHPGKKTQEVIKLREKRSIHLAIKETTGNTILLSSMDNVIAREFKNELPVIITKTLIASAIKAATTYGASRAASQKSDTAGLVMLIAGAIYQAAVNQADLRTWTTLPKEFQFCRFPTPSDRKIELYPAYSGQKTPLIIDNGIVNVVWVKSVNRNSPLSITQFKLNVDAVALAVASSEAVPVQNAPQADVSEPEQETQQHEASEPPAQPTQKNEAIAPALENQPETSMPSQRTPGDKTKTSVNMEIPLDTALRLERERILTLGDAKVRQLGMLDKESVDYFNKKGWDFVISVCKKILEIDPENFEATANIGGAYIGLREFDLAVKYLTKATQLIPAHPLPYANFVYVYAMQGDKESAMEFLQEAVDKGFKDINYLKNDKDLPEDFRNDPRLNNFIK